MKAEVIVCAMIGLIGLAAIFACVWKAGDLSREEEKEDGKIDKSE